DLADGVDQLPILQHALRQVWLAANEGREEMDLLHYAMVGGMPANDLPETDQARYAEWFDGLPGNQKKFYEDPRLNNVIEIHANRLYENAWLYYNEKNPANPITQRDAKRITALTFACLTKIDDSRAVRNRMTLQEITNIINQPNLTIDVVGGVLNLFRESSNSFLRPYKTDDEATHVITANTVLDITHESLIRNWALLNKWANQEFEFYSTFVDFKKQLARWKDSGKSSSFLLPLGPLTFFENWYNACKPNAWWIDRYAEVKDDGSASFKYSATVLNDTKEFIRRSARKVMVSRAFMKYGAQTIAMGIGFVVILALTGFYWFDSQRKTNKNVEAQVMAKAHDLLESKEVDNVNKAIYLLLEERLNEGSLLTYLSGISNKKQRTELTLAAYRLMLYHDKHIRIPLKKALRDHVLNEFKAIKNPDGEEAVFVLEQQNQFVLLLAYDEYYNPSDSVVNEIIEMSGRQYQLAKRFFETEQRRNGIVPTELNLAIQLWLTFGKPERNLIDNLLSVISPFADSAARLVFDKYYVKGRYEDNGRVQSDFSGGYHTLASLYAASGEVDHIVKCFEQLPETYFRVSLFNNYNNLLGYLYQYGHVEEARQYTEWLKAHYPSDDPLTVYRNTIIRSGYIPSLFGINFIKDMARSNDGYFHVNLGLAKREDFFALADRYEELANAEVKDADEQHYLLAMHYKRIAMLYNKYLYDRGLSVDQKQMDEWLDKAWSHFSQISEKHLAGIVTINYPYYTDGIRTIETSRKSVFLYPDYRDGFFANKFNGDLFMEYIIRKDLLPKYYSTPPTINLIHDWISSAHEVFMYHDVGEGTGIFRNDYTIPNEILDKILAFAGNSSAGSSFDKNLPLLILANRYFESGDTTKALVYYRQIEKDKIRSSGQKYEYLNRIYFTNAMIDLTQHLAATGHLEESLSLIGLFRPFHQAYFYIACTDELYSDYSPSAFTYLDSAYTTLNRINNDVLGGETSLLDMDGRPYLVYMLGKVGGEKANRLSVSIISELSEDQRIRGITNMITGTATDGNYFTALSIMPEDLTEDQELICYNSILIPIVRNIEKESSKWQGMDKALLWEFNYFVGPR
ncbi:MAG TPA: hypothetical protein VK666_16790, partial [Chryseolinea sp.]|nr:hypothetical protein [Chryseolinea sp.]